MEGEEITRITKEIAVEGIIKYAQKRMEQSVPFQILDLIIPKERWIRSIVGGLETGLGTTLWEPLAKKFAQLSGFEVVDSSILKKPKAVTNEISNSIDSIINSRSKGESTFKGYKAKEAIKKSCKTYLEKFLEESDFEKPPQGRGVDLWIKKENINYLYDIKTVRPNISGFHSYLRQILSWYHYFFARFYEEEIFAQIAFPYNPFKEEDFWGGSMGNGKPLDPITDAVVEGEFWDFLTEFKGSFNFIKKGLFEVGKQGLVSGELDKLINSLDTTSNQQTLLDIL